MSNIVQNTNGQWWTRIQLPQGVYAEVLLDHGSHSVCLYGENGQAIRDALRQWADFPLMEFDPPAVPS